MCRATTGPGASLTTTFSPCTSGSRSALVVGGVRVKVPLKLSASLPAGGVILASLRKGVAIGSQGSSPIAYSLKVAVMFTHLLLEVSQQSADVPTAPVVGQIGWITSPQVLRSQLPAPAGHGRSAEHRTCG